MQRKPSHFGSKTSSPAGSASKPFSALASIGRTGGTTGRSITLAPSPLLHRRRSVTVAPSPSGGPVLSSQLVDLDRRRPAPGRLGVEGVDEGGAVVVDHEAVEVAGLDEHLAG